MNFLANLWDYLWFFFTAMIFIAYLMTLFSIFGDIFRDKSLAGWAKALWIVFLLAFPVLAALVYLIARGGGMAERAASRAAAQQAAVDGYIRDVTKTSTPAAEIAEAKALLDSGAISAEEFETIKRGALARA